MVTLSQCWKVGKVEIMMRAEILTRVRVIPGCMWTNTISYMHLENKESKGIYHAIISTTICISRSCEETVLDVTAFIK